MKRILFLSLFLIGSTQAMEPAKTLIQSAGIAAAKTTIAIVNDCTPTTTTAVVAYCAFIALKDYFTRK